jgi:hypothetical protein
VNGADVDTLVDRLEQPREGVGVRGQFHAHFPRIGGVGVIVGNDAR